MAAKIPVRLSGPGNVATGPATKYTTPATTKTILREVIVTNPSGSPATFTLSVGADGAGTRIYDTVSIAAGDRLHEWHFIVLEAAEVIQAASGTNNALKLTINGTEQSTA